MADLTDTADLSVNFPDFTFFLNPPAETGPVPPPLSPSVKARKQSTSINLDKIPDNRDMMDFDIGEAIMDDKQSTLPQRIDPIIAQLLANRYIQEQGLPNKPTNSAALTVASPVSLPFGNPSPQPSNFKPTSPFAFEGIDPSLIANTNRITQHAHTHRPAFFSNAPNPGVAAATAALDCALFGKPFMNASALLDLEGALERSTQSKGEKRIRENVQSIHPKAAPTKRHKSKATNDERSSGSEKKSKVRVVSSLQPLRARATVLTNTAQTPPNAPLSLEDRRRIRDERNRASAERSRLRHKKRTEELKRDVYNGRIENREVKAIIDTYYVQLRGIADTIEKRHSAYDVKAPALYEALAVLKKVIDRCPWNYKESHDLEIPLKIPRA